MAKLKEKNMTQLQSWSSKELRKLKITLQNRISSLGKFANQKDLKESNLLFNKNEKECKELLEKVLRAEKKLSD